MGEDEVRIPIVLDVKNEGEVDNLTKRLRNLQEAMKSVDSMQKTRTNRGGGFYKEAAKIDRYIRSIGKYLNMSKQLGDDDSAQKRAVEVGEAVNREIGYINDVIVKYKDLQKVLGATSPMKTSVGADESAPGWVNVTSVKEINDYLVELAQRITNVNQLLESTPTKGDLVLERRAEKIREIITNLTAYAKSLQDVSNELAKTEKEAKDATAISSAMKGGKGIFFNASKNQVEIEKQEELASTARLTNEMMQAEAASTARSVRSSVDKQIEALDDLIKKYLSASKMINGAGEKMLRPSRGPEALSAKFNHASAEIESAKAVKEQAEDSAEAQKANLANIKRATSQYYYQLRAVKMLSFVFSSAYTKVDNFSKAMYNGAKKALGAYLRLIPGVNALKKALDKTHNSQKKFNREMRNTNKGLGAGAVSMGKFLITTLKAVIGVRSLYMLLRKLKNAIGEGFESMAVQLEDVNAQLSSILTSLNYMKASITAVVQPLLNALAPALEKISDLFSEITYKVSSFIAVLTGQDYVYRAIKVQADYAESLETTAEKAKKAKKELSGLDKLNVINSEQEKDKTNGMQWEKVPIDDTLRDWAEKFKEFLKKLFAPIVNAWNKYKDFIISSWKYALDEILDLGKAIAEDFWAVWQSDVVQSIFDNLAETVGYIGLIVGNLAKNFKKAWKANKNGYRILLSIAKVIQSITKHILNATKYTEKWSRELDFEPVLTAIADVLEDKVVPAVDKVLDLFETLYEQIFLKIVKDFIEKGLPQLVRLFGKIAEIVGLIAGRLDYALTYGDLGVSIITKAEDLLQIIMSAIDTAADKTKIWAENLNFVPLLTAVDKFLEKIQPVIEFIAQSVSKFWSNVLLPFWKYLIEEGGPKLLDTLGRIADRVDWQSLKQKVDEFLGSLEPFLELAWETILQIIEDLGTKLTDFLNSDTLQSIVDGFKDWVSNANPEDLASKIEFLTGFIIGLKGALALLSKVILPAIIAYKTIRNVAMQAKLIKATKDLTVALAGAEAVGEGGLALSLLTVALRFALVAGAIADLQSLFEIFRLKGIKELQDEMPKTASATNGTVKEMNALEKIMKKIYEATHPGETLLDSFIVPSDYEKLETMKDKLISMSDQMENAGKMSETTGMTIDAALDIWLSHGERMEDLTDEEVEQFTKLYKSVEDYYNLVMNNKVTTDAISEVGLQWEKVTEAAPTKETGKSQIKEYTDGISEGLAHADTTGLESYKELIKSVEDMFPDEETGKTQANDYINGIATADWEKIPDALPDEENALEEGKAYGNNAITGITQADWDTIKNYEKITDMFPQEAEAVNQGTEYGNLVLSGVADVDWESGGEDMMLGIGSGAEIGLESLNTNKWWQQILGSFDSFFDQHSPSRVMEKEGTYLIAGLSNGIVKEFPKVISSINKGDANILKTFRSQLGPTALKSVGLNTILGLDSGLMQGLSNTLRKVSEMCSRIINTATRAFKIGSPSKVFEGIGLNLMKGLEIGVEDGTDDVATSFENVVPTDAMFDDFYDNFIDTMTLLTQNVTILFDNMMSHINESLENLGDLNRLGELNRQLSNIKYNDVPAIAKGYQLPSNKEFNKATATTEVDLSDLPDIMKKAFVEALEEVGNLQSDNETFMINIDGKNIFQVVRNENTKYKKQHGASAFA